MIINLTDAALRLQFAQYAPLLPEGIDLARVADIFVALCHDQQRRVEAGRPISRIPLFALAVLLHCGFTVELPTGRIAGWPTTAQGGDQV